MDPSRLTASITSCRSFVVSAIFLLCLLGSCTKFSSEGRWDYQVDLPENSQEGVMIVSREGEDYSITFRSYQDPDIQLENLKLEGNRLSGTFEKFGNTMNISGTFHRNQFLGLLSFHDDTASFTAIRQSDQPVEMENSKININYTLSESDLPAIEKNIDHEGIISSLDHRSLIRGRRIYNANCINCHGNPEIEGSIPLSTKFWDQSLNAGSDIYSMYRTLTQGYGSMPPQPNLTPRDKYNVLLYIQQEYFKKSNRDQYVGMTPGYLAALPNGSTKGPDTQPYHPWSDMNYGNFFINTYELVDDKTGPPRYHSPGPVPYSDEDYTDNNFAYKGIAVRLDVGPGGVSKGNAWIIFDHDVMRMAGGWTGEGFIDWDGILLNDRHETYPRTVGKLHFETPVGPGWANPVTGTFEDPRFRARDGRAFGPLPKKWTNYKGLYHHQGEVVLSYTVGTAAILEKPGMETSRGQTIFTRTFNITPSTSILKARIAPVTNQVTISGVGGTLTEQDGMILLEIKPSTSVKLKLFIADSTVNDLESIVAASKPAESLTTLTHGGAPVYPEVLTTSIIPGADKRPFAADDLNLPFENPWNCRMKLSGLDFLSDFNKAVACTTDGDIWLINGLTDNSDTLTWKRIGSGLFQPLGLKILEDRIFVTCRDQLVLLHDLNGDQEIDYYESFNHDHQVTDHFHEFAMGLQADTDGNLYYAKSGRHAREALVPQHGTLIKVQKDGSGSEIIATGFRAANGVCINPDGSFIVTDQQGYWNPMNRINWITGSKKFYGNMWGYDPPGDTSRTAMEPPMVWVDMEFDRSPSELVWIESEKWGLLNGGLLSFSYGYGKIQLVLPEKVQGLMQGAVIDLPGIKFMTGVMRGRFNPADGQLYACGMSAWGTNQLIRGGGLYRIRYTGKPLPVPIALTTSATGVEISFASKLDSDRAQDTDNYKIETWSLVRSSAYGSDRYFRKSLPVVSVKLNSDEKSVKLQIEGIEPVDVMTISYDIIDRSGNALQGTLQNTIHKLGIHTDT